MTLSDPGFAHLVALIAAASGGFFGSATAFLFESWREKRRTRDHEYGVLLRTQYIFVAQLNALLNIQKQYLDEHRTDKDRFLKLVPFFQSLPEMQIPFEDLSFIVERDDVNILQQIHIVHGCYLSSLGALDQRNKRQEALYDDPAVKAEAFDFASGRAVITADARKARILKALTDALYESVDDSLSKHEALVRQLGDLIKRLFRKRKRLMFEVPGVQKDTANKSVDHCGSPGADAG